jgi:hypothetical protein
MVNVAEMPEKLHGFLTNVFLNVRFTMRTCQETFSFKDRPRSGRPSVDEDTVVEVIGSASITPQQSLREMSRHTNIPKSTIGKILKKHSFHPYKMHFVHTLSGDDFDRRIEFCEIMTARIAENDQYLHHICFSDESTFFLNGEVNTQNVRYWCDENPHVVRESHTQHPQKLNVWAGLLGNHVIPVFIDGTLTGRRYLDLLENIADPLITEIVENATNETGEPEFDVDNIVFQQDGCSAHYFRPVREYLDERFRDKWIGRRGPVEWPPRSPDLAPNDFFLWGHLKSVVYRTAPTSLDDLRNRIVTACRQIPPEVFQRVREAFHQRLFYCQEVNGAQFEHLLR